MDNSKSVDDEMALYEDAPDKKKALPKPKIVKFWKYLILLLIQDEVFDTRQGWKRERKSRDEYILVFLHLNPKLQILLEFIKLLKIMQLPRVKL